MLTLLVARHGNTFDPGDTILRVGKQTDLPLSNSGREQAKHLGIFLKEKYKKIDRVLVSSLKRTQETALIALPNMPININPMFDEIYYGLDDGKPESDVIARIGEEALKQWEEHAIVPDGWQVDPQNIIQDWRDFSKNLVEANGRRPSIMLVVTSNGIARFAPHLMANPSRLSKMRTGALSALEYDGNHWKIDYWDKRP
jgi:probable phosphoglycerate mutase